MAWPPIPTRSSSRPASSRASRGVETVSGAVIGAIVYKALSIWLVSQTDLSKLVLGGFIVLIVVAFPKGIVGTLEAIRHRRQSALAKSAPLTSSVEAAE